MFDKRKMMVKQIPELWQEKNDIWINLCIHIWAQPDWGEMQISEESDGANGWKEEVGFSPIFS